MNAPPVIAFLVQKNLENGEAQTHLKAKEYVILVHGIERFLTECLNTLRGGGIGRLGGLKSRCSLGVRVQIPSPEPYLIKFSESLYLIDIRRGGRVRLNATVLKIVGPLKGPRVRIPASPPTAN